MVQKYSRAHGVKLIPAIEISCKNRTHMLGLGIDIRNTALLRSCEHEEIIHRNRAIEQIVKLEENGFSVDHSFLRKNKGIITEYEVYSATEHTNESFHDFSQKWFYKNSPHYVTIERKTVEEAIALIHEAQGLAIWAHPGHTLKRNLDGLSQTLAEYIKLGLDGLEVFSSKHTHEQTWLLHSLAKKYKLAESGGSDYHGMNGRNLGNFQTYGLKFDPERLIDLINSTS